MADRYGKARSPQPMRGHTCKIRRQYDRITEPTSQDECPGCAIDKAEGWQELLASIRREMFVHGTHG